MTTQTAEARTLGTYQLLRELGRGGFGVVHEAVDTRDGTRVAVKTLTADLEGEKHRHAYARFVQEMRAVERVAHPNVVQLKACGHSGDDGNQRNMAFIAMELVDGVTLDRLVLSQGVPPSAMGCDLVRQAARGLHAAHEAGIIHRDVKPQNIMVTPELRAVVMDFGVCKLTEHTAITLPGQVLGTMRYLAPEQLRGMDVDPRVDVFALGAVLYFVLTGRHVRAKQAEKLLQVALEDVAPLVDAATEIPDCVRPLLRRTLQIDRELRPKSARQFADELSEVIPLMDSALDRTVAVPRVKTGVVPVPVVEDPTLPSNETAPGPPPPVVVKPPAVATSTRLVVRPPAPSVVEDTVGTWRWIAACAVCSLAALMLGLWGGLVYTRVRPPPVDEERSLSAALEASNSALTSGDVIAALVQARDALRLDPFNAEAHRLIASVLTTQGEHCRAHGHYQLALTYGPNSVNAENVRRALKDPRAANCK